jgi:hypothetical protein
MATGDNPEREQAGNVRDVLRFRRGNAFETVPDTFSLAQFLPAAHDVEDDAGCRRRHGE